MKMTSKGLALIKRYEGFRSRAYRDAVGVWTIGYGHTSRAGPPNVSAGMVISRKQAEKILTRDIDRFARTIRPMIKVDLTNEQFSALVSFAYNVGPAGFARSSVLKAVNAGQFDNVPHRLSLWVKAGGRTLKGLVRRRAAEGELFIKSKPSGEKRKHRPVKPVHGKPPEKSTTILAAIVSALAGLVSTFVEVLNSQKTGIFILAVTTIIILATIWVIRERVRKSSEYGV
jgi:lysozyme